MNYNVDLFLDRVAADVARHKRVSEIHHMIDETMKPYSDVVDRKEPITLPAADHDTLVDLARELRILLGFDTPMWDGPSQLTYYSCPLVRGDQ